MLIKTWERSLSKRWFTYVFICALFSVLAGLIATRFVLLYNDTRHGALLNDPILALIKPLDVSFITFLFTYGTVVLGLMVIAQNPNDMVMWMFSYFFLLICRMLSLYFVPLEPPRSMVFLNDPLIAYFTGFKTPTHDLFFSGHTATAFLIYFTVKKYKQFFLFLAVAIGVLVVLQHVHYSIDVIAAPFFAYFCFKLGKKLTDFLSDYFK